MIAPLTDAEVKDLAWHFNKSAIIPFLGAGASAYCPGDEHGAPPPGRELMQKLSEGIAIVDAVFCTQGGHARVDLSRVASYDQTMRSRPDLNRTLVELLIGPPQEDEFSNDLEEKKKRILFAPNPLHRLLARIAKQRPMLIITTNYDTLLEAAFDMYEVPYEVMATPNDYDYIESEGGDTGTAHDDKPNENSDDAEAGTIWHRLGATPVDDDRVQAINALPEAERPSPQEFRRIAPNLFSTILNRRSLIYKIHGTLRRRISTDEWEGDFVIAEEDYVRFLGRLSASPDLIPSAIFTKLKARPHRTAADKDAGQRPLPSRLMFLGYGLNDWNMRVLMHTLGVGQGRATDRKHYLIDKNPDVLQQRILDKNDFRICPMDLADFVGKLNSTCERYKLIPPDGGGGR